MARRYDLIVRGARVIDPAQALDGPADIGVSGDRIVQTVDARG